jgi:hypothetical protein
MKRLAVLVIALALAGGAIWWDYSAQNAELDAMMSRLELLESRLQSSDHDGPSVQALRGLYNQLRDETVTTSDRWIGSGIESVRSGLDEVDARLTALEGRVGVRR